jgi:hypothetical protein
MFRRSTLLWAVALATILSMVGGAAAMAQTMATNETGWVTLGPGQQHWYSFSSTTADSKATDAQIQLLLASSPEGGATFNVWTPANLQSAAAGNTDINSKPIGGGTLHSVKDGASSYDLFRGKLEWTGSSFVAQDYLVQVISNSAAPVQYDLMADGNYLKFADGTFASQASKQNIQMASATKPMQAAQPAMQAVAMQTGNNLPAPVVLPSTGMSASPSLGASPDMPLSLNDSMHQLNPGQTQWYVLQYPGELKGGDIPEATLELIAANQREANFSVWTLDRLHAQAAGDTTFGIPVGNGSLHPFTDGGVTYDRYNFNPAWTIKTKIPDTFYVEVQNTGSFPTTYTLKYTQQ